MNKRLVIAWQLWLERRTPETIARWRYLSWRLPMWVRVWFARYVQKKFMGGRERFPAFVLSFLVFHFVARVILPLTKGEK